MSTALPEPRELTYRAGPTHEEVDDPSPARTHIAERSDGVGNGASNVVHAAEVIENNNDQAIRRLQPRRALKEDDDFSLVMVVTPILLVLFAYIALRAGALIAKPRFNWAQTKYVFAFGDSYTSVQGTKGLANFSFIGDLQNFQLSREDLLSNEIVPRNTSSDGSNWLEFLTGCFEGRPSQCSPHQLWDFAFAGADIDGALLPLHHPFTVSLVDQVKQWVTSVANIIPHPPAETITFWWIGLNDTGDTVTNSSIASFSAFWKEEMTSYFNAVEFAVGHGLGGAHFFINVPPEHRNPSFVNSPDASMMRTHIEGFNAVLDTHIQRFAAKHNDLNVFSFDAFNFFNQVLDEHQQFGFENITGFCECSDPKFFWFNSGHPTERVHKLIAEAIEAQLIEASKPR